MGIMRVKGLDGRVETHWVDEVRLELVLVIGRLKGVAGLKVKEGWEGVEGRGVALVSLRRVL